MRRDNISNAVADQNKILVGQVAQTHAQVVGDVIPLPAGLRGNRTQAVHQIVKDAVQPRARQSLKAGEVPAQALLFEYLVDLLRDHDRMVVHGDRNILG